MHTVLNLKANGTVAKYDKAFEEGLRQTRTGSLLVHDDWPKLL